MYTIVDETQYQNHQNQEQQNIDKRLQAVETNISKLTKGLNTQLNKHQQLLSTMITQCLKPTIS